VLSRGDLEGCFEPEHFIRHVRAIFERVLGKEEAVRA
jgi:hypothetical protein